jgi:uncharacterized membrane protein YfcA
MEAETLSILVVAAFATAILSAIVGMAGGIVLLSVMLLFLPPLAAIPLHGAVQLVSNGSRTWFQRRHVERGLVLRYSALLLPMSFAGLAIATSLPPSMSRALIGVFVLLATWVPGALTAGLHPESSDRRRRFVVLGGVVGLLNPTVGATGPLLAPFFLNLGLDRQGIIGTKAACQALGHLAKLAVFGVAGFAFLRYLTPLLVLSAAVVAGTWVGSRILGRVSEVWFTRLYKGVLTLIALRLVILELPTLLGR